MVLVQAKEVGWFAFAILFWPARPGIGKARAFKNLDNRTRPTGNVSQTGCLLPLHVWKHWHGR